MSESKSITAISNQLSSIITQGTIDKISNMLKNANSEMDAVLCSELLIQTRNMLEDLKRRKLIRGSIEANLIIEEIKIRLIEMDRLIEKTRKNRPMPNLSDEDRRVCEEIKNLCKGLFGNVKLTNVVPMLMEANKIE